MQKLDPELRELLLIHHSFESETVQHQPLTVEILDAYEGLVNYRYMVRLVLEQNLPFHWPYGKGLISQNGERICRPYQHLCSLPPFNRLNRTEFKDSNSDIRGKQDDDECAPNGDQAQALRALALVSDVLSEVKTRYMSTFDIIHEEWLENRKARALANARMANSNLFMRVSPVTLPSLRKKRKIGDEVETNRVKTEGIANPQKQPKPKPAGRRQFSRLARFGTAFVIVALLIIVAVSPKNYSGGVADKLVPPKESNDNALTDNDVKIINQWYDLANSGKNDALHSFIVRKQDELIAAGRIMIKQGEDWSKRENGDRKAMERYILAGQMAFRLIEATGDSTLYEELKPKRITEK
ncbi:MAG: hypothetical protein ACE5IR_08030 [bacterium]